MSCAQSMAVHATKAEPGGSTMSCSRLLFSAPAVAPRTSAWSTCKCTSARITPRRRTCASILLMPSMSSQRQSWRLSAEAEGEPQQKKSRSSPERALVVGGGADESMGDSQRLAGGGEGSGQRSIGKSRPEGGARRQQRPQGRARRGLEVEDAEQEAQGDLREHLEILSKTGLANSQAVRSLMGMNTHTYLVPSSLSSARMGVEAGAQYESQTKGKPGHGLGAPHPHIFLATLEGLIMDVQKVEGELGVEAHRVAAELQLYQKGFDQGGPPVIHSYITYFVVKPLYVAARTRITFRVDPMPVVVLGDGLPDGHEGALRLRRTLHLAMKIIGAEHKEGAAPRGELERVLQTQLRRVQRMR